MLKAARTLYFTVDRSIRSLPLAVLQWLHFQLEFAGVNFRRHYPAGAGTESITSRGLCLKSHELCQIRLCRLMALHEKCLIGSEP